MDRAVDPSSSGRLPEDRPRRSAFWPRMLVISGVLAAGIAAFFFVAESRLDERWKQFETQVKEEIERERARVVRRPALYGETTPGNAWDSYRKALAIGQPLDPQYRLHEYLAGPAATGKKYPSQEEVDAILSAQPDLPLWIKEGAHAEMVDWGHEWEKGSRAAVPRYGPLDEICVFLTVCVLEQAKRGAMDLALETALDALQFSLDLAEGVDILDGVIAVGMQGIVEDALKSWLEEGQLNAAQLQRLAEALDRADTRWRPTMDVLRTDLLALKTIMSSWDGNLATVVRTSQPVVRVNAVLDQLSLWKYGFSSRRAILIFMAEQEQLFKDLEGISRNATVDRLKQMEALADVLRQRGCDMSRGHFINIAHVEKIFLEGRSHLRLLRAAAQIRRLDSFPSTAPGDFPADPFGAGSLRCQRSADGNTCAIYSVGRDGVDDGGAGDWSPKDTGDVVLMLRRRPP